jgi:uncharacterized protein (TIGR03000 family)
MRSLVLCALVGVGFLAWQAGPLFAAEPEPLPATIRVTLPADAKLTIDDHSTLSTSANRSFVTPPLAVGRVYHYDFKAEYTRAGKTITIQEVVTVRPGLETVVDLNPPGLENAVTPASYTTGAEGGIVPAAFTTDVPPNGTPRSPGFLVPAGPLPGRFGTPAREGFIVAPMSEQGPSINAGPPGSNSSLGLPVGEG